MTDFNMQAELVVKIDELASAERVTKQLLGELSRDLLSYIPDTNDVGMANRLIAVLTPMNKATALLFFKHFLPWSMDDTGSVFTKKETSPKRLDKKLDAIRKFLSEEGNNIWVWAESNVEVEKKQFNLSDNVKRAVELALKGKEESKSTEAADPISPAEIIAAVIAAGVTPDDVLNAITSFEDVAEAA